jgi:hypothetical protein
MKVLDLQCTHLHGFEGWFASEEDFQDQLVRGLVACPVCNDTAVVKLLSAPRLNLGGSDAQAPPPPSFAVAARSGEAVQAAQATWLQLLRRVMANTEDVGERFAEVARQMHYGEAQERSIRGKASAQETEALLDEGIPVLPLLVPEALKEPLQ